MAAPGNDPSAACGFMNRVYQRATYLFDPLHQWWESDRTQRSVAGLLIATFLLGMACIEMNRQGWLPDPLAARTPTSHYMAISLAFTLVLILEVVSLIFTLPCSISKAVGKQFEILALILLRNSFKELVHFPEPITIGEGELEALKHIAVDGISALVIFGLLGLYMLLRKDPEDEQTRGATLFSFVSAKKIVALTLLACFLGMGSYNLWLFFHGYGHDFDFFLAFYTVLIFSDILLVLISQRFHPSFRAVFRNSGFALATLFIRLALTAPPYYNAILGVGAAAYAVLLTVTYNTLFSRPRP
ncbi:hypothetical protein [Salidesulfovibrio onnuriiensis]|uniref:hypothetical protein n=1 Tax=Salidesulfovibrio onnuriiensis TaxID=2583823 RepID=UPI00202B13F4|nr:hypothetical protein [Salidesulfovibrio onnuriiensis]